MEAAEVTVKMEAQGPTMPLIHTHGLNLTPVRFARSSVRGQSPAERGKWASRSPRRKVRAGYAGFWHSGPEGSRIGQKVQKRVFAIFMSQVELTLKRVKWRL